MNEANLEYYCRRREQELMLQATAASPEAASAHRALALIYAEEVRRLMPRDARLKVVVSNARDHAPAG